MSKTQNTETQKSHEQAKIFVEFINFTAGKSGFSERLIEKDYFCTLLLDFLNRHSDGGLIFKGGTSLAKVFFDFYRVSEDLDFIIPMPVTAKQKERSSRVGNLKNAVGALPQDLPVFHVADGLKGANSSRQYLASIGYTSLLDGHPETITLEIGLREPILLPAVRGRAKTMLLNATNSQPVIVPLEFECLSLKEALAEKFRAALSRREVAIRDFYDIEYADSRKLINFDEPDFITMVQKKLAIPENDPPNSSDERLGPLEGQLENRLKPVLRITDYTAFNLNRAVAIVKRVHDKLNHIDRT